MTKKDTDEFSLVIEEPTRDDEGRYYAGIRIHAKKGSEPGTSNVEKSLKGAHAASDRKFLLTFAKYITDWHNDNKPSYGQG